VSRDRQAVVVVAVLRLVGPQDANAGVEFPGTPQAVVTARIGSSLLYLHEEQTAAHLRRVWEDAWLEAKLLPQLASPKWVAPVTGMREPGVVVHAHGRPAAAEMLVRTGEELPPYLRIQFGRVVFEVHDVRAYDACLQTFRRAHDLARAAFGTSPGMFTVRAGALGAASDAFTPPAARSAPRRTRNGGVTPRSAPAAPRVEGGRAP
jgi:hypothetical protein